MHDRKQHKHTWFEDAQSKKGNSITNALLLANDSNRGPRLRIVLTDRAMGSQSDMDARPSFCVSSDMLHRSEQLSTTATLSEVKSQSVKFR
jgi:hypothetical protein